MSVYMVIAIVTCTTCYGDMQIFSRYDADELAVLLEQLLDLKSFVERNMQFFLAPDQLG